ncbi:MAG: hypothetical protein IK130_07420 [Oscillospiraceae bacterium]|nr:hypothetical protein [Oscillospiraceae bacterium]
MVGNDVKVPVKVVSDPGTSGLTMEFKVAEGFKITGYTWGNAYPAGNVEWNAETCTIVWADKEGKATVAEPGSTVLTLTVSIPKDAKTRVEYPVEFNKAELSASGENAIEHNVSKSTNGWIMAITEGDIVFGVGQDEVFAGEEAKLPISVMFDKGATQFAFDIVLPEGMTITGTAYDAQYQANGTFSVTGNRVQWTKNADSTFVPEPAHTILTITVAVPETTAPGEYKVTLANAEAKMGEEAMATEIVDGKITVLEPVKAINVTDFEITFTAPTRENYWSHDTRKFGDGQNGTNDGLVGMKALVTVYSYAVNEKNNHFVDADGKDILDANGEPMIYEAGGKFPARDLAVKVDKDIDVTEFVRCAEAAQTPQAIWDAAEDKEGTIKNIQELSFYFFQEENAPVKLGNGTDPVLMGTKKIYIGVKGDINLDNKVDSTDAKLALDYHVAVHLSHFSDYQLNADPILDRKPSKDSNEQGLAFYLGNVIYKEDKEPYLDSRDAKAILDYYVARQLTHLSNYTWVDAAGYDFLDEFYPGY